MFKHISLLILASLSYAEDKKVTYDELCKYESACSRVKDADGSMLKPKLAVKKLVEMMSDPVIEYGIMYGVDPRAVGGAIMAENTMNVQIDDDIQSWVVKNGVWGSGALMEKGMTVGPGQIYIEAARAADQYIASLGLRPARSDAEITKRLLTPAGAAEYSAAIMRKAQDAYKAKGIDISKNPEILVSLYNMGEDRKTFEQRAEDNLKDKQPPRPNFFGFFVQENLKELEQVIGWSPEKGRFRKSKFDDLKSGALFAVNDVLDLKSSPPGCTTAGRGEVGIWNQRLSWEGFQNFRTSQVGIVEVVGRGVDCQLREWLQVKTPLGDIGWVERADLTANAEPVTDQSLVQKCEDRAKPCIAEALKAYGEAKVLRRGDTGTYYLPVKRKDAADPADGSIDGILINNVNGYESCGDYQTFKKSIQEQMKNSTGKPLAKAEMKTLVARIEAKEAEWAKFHKPKKKAPKPNPYGLLTGQGLNPAQMFDPSKMDPMQAAFFNAKSQLLNCLAAEKFDCVAFQGQDKLENLLNADFSKVKSLKDLLALTYVNYFLQMVNPSEASQEEIARKKEADRQKRASVIRMRSDDMMKACSEIKDIAPTIHADLEAVANDVENLSYVDARGYDNLFGEIKNICYQVWFLDEHKKTGKFPTGDTKLNCEFRNGTSADDPLLNFSMDLMANLDFEENDFRDLFGYRLSSLVDGIKWAKKQKTNSKQPIFGQFNPSGQNYSGQLARCNYSPVATAKGVEELAKNPCIQNILVHDMNMAKNIEGRSETRIVRDFNLKPDEIAFTVKYECYSVPFANAWIKKNAAKDSPKFEDRR